MIPFVTRIASFTAANRSFLPWRNQDVSGGSIKPPDIVASHWVNFAQQRSPGMRPLFKR